MFAERITYVDYNGTERTEEFLFNLTKTELSKMELSKDGGFASKLTAIIDAKDRPEIMKHFENIILGAYGEKSEDGKYFDKSEAVRQRFSQSAAYDKLFMDLLTDDEKAAKFIDKLIPEELRQDNQSIPAPPLK